MNINNNISESRNVLILSIIICIATYFPGIFLIVFQQTITSLTTPIKTSSQMKGLGPEGLLNNIQPGWHAEKSPQYPQTITITFKTEKTLSSILIHPQDDHYNRSPNQVRINWMKNDKIWTKGEMYNFPCLESNNSNNDYTKISLNQPITTKKIQLEIMSNCGDLEFLTLKGIKII